MKFSLTINGRAAPEFFRRRIPPATPPDFAAVAALAAALHTMSRKPVDGSAAIAGPSPWLQSGRSGLLR